MLPSDATGRHQGDIIRVSAELFDDSPVMMGHAVTAIITHFTVVENDEYAIVKDIHGMFDYTIPIWIGKVT
jgi:hypothetical protein